MITNIRSNNYTDVSYDPEARSLTMIWKKDSSQLKEDEVKEEIGNIVRFVREYGIRNVIVDARDYKFRTDPALQEWISRTYIPRIMESKVTKYAIVVESDLIQELRAAADPGEVILPVVDYFATLVEAEHWIKSV